MNTFAFLGAYGLTGACVAALVALRRISLKGYPPWMLSTLSLALWPFLLPLIVPGRIEAPRSRRDHGLDRLEQQLEEALRKVDVGALQSASHREGLSAFVTRLRADNVRLLEVDDALRTAPEAARQGLQTVRERAEQRRIRGTELLEALIAQLTLLRFAEIDDPATDGREQVEELLARMQELCALEAPKDMQASAP